MGGLEPDYCDLIVARASDGVGDHNAINAPRVITVCIDALKVGILADTTQGTTQGTRARARRCQA